MPAERRALCENNHRVSTLAASVRTVWKLGTKRIKSTYLQCGGRPCRLGPAARCWGACPWPTPEDSCQNWTPWCSLSVACYRFRHTSSSDWVSFSEALTEAHHLGHQWTRPDSVRKTAPRSKFTRKICVRRFCCFLLFCWLRQLNHIHTQRCSVCLLPVPLPFGGGGQLTCSSSRPLGAAPPDAAAARGLQFANSEIRCTRGTHASFFSSKQPPNAQAPADVRILWVVTHVKMIFNSKKYYNGKLTACPQLLFFTRK